MARIDRNRRCVDGLMAGLSIAVVVMLALCVVVFVGEGTRPDPVVASHGPQEGDQGQGMHLKGTESPFVVEPVLRRAPVVSQLELLDTETLHGRANFNVMDFVSDDCVATDAGKTVPEVMVRQSLDGVPEGFTLTSFEAYVGASQLLLSNVSIEESPTGPGFRADVRMVPRGGFNMTQGTPPYLDAHGATLTWVELGDEPYVVCGGGE